MMQCVRRCSFICGAVLSILLLLCSCQAGAGQLILPDNIPSENTSQGKKELLAALNTIGIRRPETTPGLLYPRCRLCRRDDLPVHPEEIWQQCSRCHQATVCERGYRVCKLRQCSLEQAFAFSRRDIFCELCSSQRRCSGRWCLAGRC